ncbi:MAG: hypothetical protein ACYC1S_10430 [Gemmatimonadaceae bacterium]
MSIMRATWTVATMLATSLIITQPAQGQVGGLLRRAKQKAAEKVSGKAEDVARGSDTTARRGSDRAASRRGSGAAAIPTSPAARAPAARGGGNFRREKPLDPTVLETPGHAAGVPGQQRSWHGTAMTADEFKSTIPEITEARLAAYLRARAAMTDDALHLNALFESKEGRVDSVRRYMGQTLARDELPPIPGYMKVWPMAGPRRVERHLDGVLEQALGGAMTRMQFYQLHEMVELYLTGQVNRPGMSTGVQGRRLTGAEIALLQKHRAALDALREKQRQLR